jgi:hypothetical protein
MFGAATGSPLARQLAHVNAFGPTQMCRVMTQFGSDKGQGWHNYTTVYSALLGNLRNRPLRIFEIGLGTNNTDLISNMGVHGRPGASLRGWRELFPQAAVYGADIDRDVLFEEESIKTFYCDQLSQDAIRSMWSQPDLRDAMDVIIDDGRHTFEANTSFLEGSLQRLKPGGFYFVEDIATASLPRWRNCLPTYSQKYPTYEFALVELPNDANDGDNNMLVIRSRE